MKILFPRVTSALFLLIFCGYMLLGCVPQKDANVKTVDATIQNIQQRLKAKDYQIENKVENPRQDLKKEMRKAMHYMSSKGFTRPNGHQVHKAHQVNYTGSNSIFRLASYPSFVNQASTFGIDDPAQFDLVVAEATNYYSGAYSASYVRDYMTNLNNQLRNYPMTYTGASNFLTDKVNDGTLTQNQRVILEAEMTAIANATSETEVLNILNVVSQELVGSQLSQSEMNMIYTINAGVEGAAEYQAIAQVANGGIYHQTGAVVGAVVFGVGAIVMGIGMFSGNDTMVAAGFSLGICGCMIAII